MKDKKSGIDILLDAEKEITERNINIGKDAYLLLAKRDGDILFSGQGRNQDFVEMLYNSAIQKEIVGSFALAVALLMGTNDDFANTVIRLLGDYADEVVEVVDSIKRKKSQPTDAAFANFIPLANKTKS